MKKIFCCCIMCILLSLPTLAANNKKASLFCNRFEQFVDSVKMVDTLSVAEKRWVTARYKQFTSQYNSLKNNMSESDLRRYNRAKVAYQKHIATITVGTTAGTVAGTAAGVGTKVKSTFKRTRSKVLGLFDGLKE